MKLTSDERQALAFIAALLTLSAVLRFVTLPEPVDAPAGGFDLAGHIEAVREGVAEAEEMARPLVEGERIDPNTAPMAQLARLPGVGPAMAERIIEDRERNGRFMRAEDLQRVRGIGPRTFEGLVAFLAFPDPRRRSAPSVAGIPSVPIRPFPDDGRVLTGAGRDGADGADRQIDLNSAGVEELVALSGIGPVLAARIVAYRDSAGPFREVSDLAHVRGIGPATLERLTPRLVVR